jgi:4-hydroxybenzoate polyprenyltransferase/phosphoserine phosphatase
MSQTNLHRANKAVHTVPPLCVDLDGTLIATNTLHETLIAVAGNPAVLASLPRWLMAGKAVLKRELARSASLNMTLLPYNQPLLEYLRREKASGRYLVLATAADRSIAEAVQAHLGLFDEIIASDGVCNLRGKTKAKVLAERFGEQGFAYAGNDRTDLPVWRQATRAVLVNTSSRVARAAAAVSIEAEFHTRTAPLPACIKALRPYQWIKNLLVFIPLITAHALDDAQGWRSALLLFAAFCTIASGLYLVNDLSDLAADRHHPHKRYRPFAKGTLPLISGVTLVPVLFLLSLGLATASGAAWAIVLYTGTSTAYSFWLKQWPLIDLFTLAGLYTIRLFAGGEASGYRVSMWLLAFSSFFFFSLAVIKRVSELMAMQARDEKTVPRRGYVVSDLQILQLMGVSATFVSVLVLALYVQSEATRYTRPTLLWLIVPLMLFWQCRLWLATARGNMHDDPIVYTAKDWISWLSGFVLVAILTLAAGPL